MKRALFTLVILTMLVSACAPKTTAGTTSGTATTLTVSMGDMQKTYMPDDLKALGAVQETFKDVTYVGVPLMTLLKDAGINTSSISVVKVVATDGYTMNYDSSTFALPDTMVAYARADGPLSDTEAPFTMVLPGQEGKMNARMVVQIVAMP
jgi:DMSO/TMAO reductase YedYZ molybdopterin-dependent catalytic subunit